MINCTSYASQVYKRTSITKPFKVGDDSITHILKPLTTNFSGPCVR